jgi:putative ABC transport system permease protein
MNRLMQDIRYGIRVLWKSPGFTIVAVTALALGIGANTAIFSVVNAVLLRPLPFDQPEHIVRLMSTNPRKGLTGTSQSFLDFADIRDQSRSFESIAAFTETTASLTGGETAEQVNGVDTSAEVFELLRTKPQLGRTFSREDEQPGGAQVVVISYDMWQKRFGSDPGIIGRQLILNGKSRSIVGVMPAGFNFLFSNEKPEYWLPLDPKGEMSLQRGAHYLEVIARLKSDVEIKQAESEVMTIAARLEKLYPEDNAGRSVSLEFEHEHMVGNIRPTLLIILGAVGFVLLIACANVANLLLARASSRGREIALRSALGATRYRIVRQLLTESIILALLGGALGLLIAVWGVDLLSSFIPASIPRVHETGLDSTVLFFTLGSTLLTGMLFGVAPAFQISRIELNEALKEGARSSTGGRSRQRLRSLLIISEVALSLVLLVSAGLLIRSFFSLRNVDPGFKGENVLTASISLPEGVYKDDAKIQEFYRQLIDETKRLPGVESAAAILPLPLSDSGINTSFTVGGAPDPGPGQRPLSGARIVTPDYFHTMKIPVIAGRSFTDGDTDKSPKVVIINRTLARQFFPNDSAIGKRLKLGLNDIDAEIIGIVPDVRHRHLDTESGPEYYVPLSEVAIDSMSLVVRTRNVDPGSLSASIRAVVRGLDRDLPVYKIRPMQDLVGNAVARQRFSMTLLVFFAGLALVLAVVGIFSVMSFLVAQRTHEFGIRMALGAPGKNILGLVVKQGMTLVLIGLAFGIGCSLLATRVMARMLFGVGAQDPLTMVSVSLILAVVALIACMAPALKATRVDPIVALRDE